MTPHITLELFETQRFSSTFLERFFSKIAITDSCWFWGGAKTCQNGHGLIARGRNGDGRILVHRAMWIFCFGLIPEGVNVLHDCPDGDCPWCVNPAHLWLGSQKENAIDAEQKGMMVHYLGEASPNAKLTQAQVIEARMSDLPQRAMAAKLGVSKTQIARIRRFQSWASVEH